MATGTKRAAHGRAHEAWVASAELAITPPKLGIASARHAIALPKLGVASVRLGNALPKLGTALAKLGTALAKLETMVVKLPGRLAQACKLWVFIDFWRWQVSDARAVACRGPPKGFKTSGGRLQARAGSFRSVVRRFRLRRTA